MAMHAAAQLWSALFAGGDAVGEGRELVLWFKGPDNEATGRTPKRSAWATSIPQAVALLEGAAGAATYFHVALHDRTAAVEAARQIDARKHAEEVRAAEREQRAPRRARGPRSLFQVRGASASARVLGAFHADFDVRGPDHKSEKLPTDRQEILDKLRGCPLEPSFLVYTGGGGIQAWWALREPLEVPDHELTRAKTYGLVKGWELFLKQALGLEPDPTADLARLMRVPGVLDARRGVEVTMPTATGKAYNPDDFAEYALDLGPLFDKEKRAARVIDAGGLRLDPNAQPPWPKISTLLAMDARFGQTWTRQRKELKSQSEYDLSLAAQLLPLGLSDQEVVDCLIWHRREAGEKEKLRPDYYAATLGKVRSDGRADDAYRRLDEAAARDAPVSAPEPAIDLSAPKGSPPKAPAAPPPTDQKQLTLAALRDALGVDLRAVIKHPSDPDSTYVLVIGAQRHTMGGVETLLEAGSFRRRLADIAKVVVRLYKPAQWQPIAKMLLRVSEDETLGTESDPAGNISDLVVAYLDMRLDADPDHELGTERKLIAGERQPFVDARVHQPAIFLLEFGGWLRMRMGADYTQKRLAQLLRWAGATPKVYAARKAEDDGSGDSRTTTSAWLIPSSIYPLAPRRAPQEPRG